MTDASFTVRADAPIGTISPRLYGHFAEHLGRCCYDGLWVGAGRPDIPQQAGLRSDVLAALRAAGAALALAGRLLCRPLPLARRHRPARRAPAAAGDVVRLAGG